MLILQKKEITTLLNYGIIFDECYAQKLIAYLIQSTQEAPEVKSYRKLGWINNNDDILRFKLHKLITKKEEADEYKYNGDLDIIPRGNLKEWQNMVKSEVVGNAPLIFVLAAGFASSVLSLLNEKYDLGCIIFNLSNYSSKGKTTAAMLAVSAFSNPKVNAGTLTTYNATDNAISEIVANCNGVTVALDEVAMNGSRNFSRLLYSLCSGTSKNRLNGDSTLKEVKRYSSIIISTAEFDIIDDGSPEGLKARVFEITDPLTTNSLNSNNIKTCVLNNYAVAGEKFIEKLIVYGKDKVFELYDKAVNELKRVQVKSDLKDRVISKIAVIWITEYLMNEFFDFNIDDKETANYIVKLIKRISAEASPEEKLLNIVQEIVAENRMKFSCLGVINEYESYTDVNFYQKEFENLMKKYDIINFKKSLKILKSKGKLITESDRLTKRFVDSHSLRVNCYCFRFYKSESSSDDDIEITEG